MTYSRPLKSSLLARLAEPPKRIQILAGPRQVGKTTLVQQIRAERPSDSIAYFAADASPKPTLWADFNAGETAVFARGSEPLTENWLKFSWEAAEAQAARWHDKIRNTPDARAFVIVLDEIQKIPQWSSLVKGLWDRQIISPNPMHLVLLGSAPLLMQKGLTESLAGRFEVIPMTHWSFEEMNDAFDFSLDEYVYFGGYPGSAPYIRDEPRWRDYVVRGLIEPNIEKDILMMTRVDKPALLKQLFELGCAYSGQIVSLTKIKGQLNDAGNTTTLTGYLELLRQAGLLTGLQKFAANELRKRGSPPKFQVLNNALMSAMGSHTLKEAIADRTYWGRLVESAVGAHLVNTAGSGVQIHYWREGGSEVDFVVERGKQLAAIEVKSGAVRGQQKGLAEFTSRQKHCRNWVVGGDDLPLGEFLRYPASHWVE
jgi:uncharacterized protein